MRGNDSLEQPSGDDEDSACIGAESTPEVTIVQADVQSGPDANQVYGGRWE